MKALNYHPHIVCFLGYVTDIAHPLLIFEYCANGDLLHFVRANKKNFVEVSFFFATKLISTFRVKALKKV
jgi:hypothetical protein